LLGGGFYEPIFPIIPDEDKSGQIHLMSNFIKEHLEFKAKGLWLTERVWEDSLSDIFLKEGLEYTIVDENHLRRAGVPEEKIHGYFETKNGFKVFAASKKLRYIIPFAGIRDVTRYFETIRDKKDSKDLCVTFADDGEKFGFWPHTYDWVYKKGWLERFFKYLSDPRSPVETVSFKSVFEKFSSCGEVNIPPSSYSEMMEWSGGDFNNFFKFYPEANIMRNRMLSVSGIIDDIEKESKRTSVTVQSKLSIEKAKRELYKAQAGCAYWHGVFGGFYMNHLRAGVYKHLINATNILAELTTEDNVRLRACDLDGDKKDEVILGNRFLDLYINPDRSGSIFGFDEKRRSYNMVNIITRRLEPYHSKLFKMRSGKLKNIKKNIEKGRYVNIHDILGVKGKGLKNFLVYDEGKKNSVIEYFSAGNRYFKGDAADLIKLEGMPHTINKRVDKDRVSLEFERTEDINLRRGLFRLNIKKELIVQDAPEFRIDYSLKNVSNGKFSSVFGMEFNWSFMNKYYLKKRNFRNLNSFILKDEWSGIQLNYRFSIPVGLHTEPIFTLNETEAGLDKTYQYLSMFVQRPVSLRIGEGLDFSITVSVD